MKYILPRDTKPMFRSYAWIGFLVGFLVSLVAVVFGTRDDWEAAILFVGVLVVPSIIVAKIWRYPDFDISISGSLFCALCFLFGSVVPEHGQQLLVAALDGPKSAAGMAAILVMKFVVFGAIGVVIACLYAVFARVVLAVVRRFRQVIEEGRYLPPNCLQCGYSLLNLTQYRCPECGTTFNPRMFMWPVEEMDVGG